MAAVPLGECPELQSFIVPDVRPTGRFFGSGRYGAVVELEIDGTVCAGRVIEEAWTSEVYQQYSLFFHLRHPHVVQFLGICFLPDNKFPVLVMERMETNLNFVLETILRITLAAKISILQDVARGLVYLHNRSPPVTHQNLTANSILLTCGMRAKIGGFGSVQPDLTSFMTVVPVTVLYMPPEAIQQHYRCHPSWDMFSFGHLSLFVALQEFPGHLLAPTYQVPLTRVLRSRTENERRQHYLKQLDGNHPLLQPTRQCLNNVPERRPTARQVLERLGEIIAATEDPYGHVGRLQLQESLLGNKGKGREECEFQTALFAELKPFTRNVQVTGKQLGHGAHGSVVEVKMGEKIFAAKSFREMSLTNVQNFVRTFCAKMMLLLKLNHPNVLKYEGICFLSTEQKTPSLLMEQMTCSLHSYLLQPENKNRPICEKASILQDVANGLRYLHHQIPAIVHRDLTATNILLDSRLVAKIADFGNSRIIDLNPLATPQTLSANPGTINYMPPEVCEKSSENTDKLDIFSFGHLSLFTIVQETINLLAPTYMENETVCGRSEIERRKEYVKKAEQMLGETHMLVVMTKKCLNLDAARRPSAQQLFSGLEKFVCSLPEKQLRMEDLHEVTTYLIELSKEQIYSLGLALGLMNCTLKESKDSSLRMYLTDVLEAWLRKQDSVEKVGPPTWMSLVKALRDGTVRQNGIASNIEKDKLQPC